MELYAVFETWHLGDGNYPPLQKGELVNLSFEFDPDELRVDWDNPATEFHHIGQARFQFTGTVSRVYGMDDRSYPIVVIEADHFCFYMYSPMGAILTPGNVVIGCGTLLFDHYIWVEYLADYPDPPNLFYKLRVGDIWKRRIPERFIRRSARGIAYPTRCASEDYAPSDITQVDAVSDEDFVDYVIQFSDRDIPDEPIARTFFS